MAWETISKRSTPNNVKEWNESPCVKFNISGICFNKKFSDAYIGDRAGIMIFKDVENKRVGFKIPGDQDPPSDIRRIGTPSGSSVSGAKYVACKDIINVFPDVKGRTFRAILNNGERIVEVDLSPANLCHKI